LNNCPEKVKLKHPKPANLILPSSIQEVNDAAKIEEVVGDFVNLKRRGANYSGLCPFHNEKSPSFNVNPARNIFKCFGCGKAGDPITFVMEHEQVSYPEAVRFLAKKYRIELKETESSDQQRQEQQAIDSLYLINQFAQEYFQGQLFDTDKGRSVGLSYFKQRGFREETIKKFGLGFAQNDMDGLLRAGKQKGYNSDQLKKLGLVTQYDRDFFRDRVMFSIHNLTGKVIAFAGRIMAKDPKQPKYINSPETEIYYKSKVLYGIFFAKKAIRQFDECLLVEGYTDVISLHQSGIENVVASSGTALTPDQIRLIKRFTNNIKIIYDGDAAGIKAALRGLDLALAEDMNVRLVLLPDGEDPDSYIQKVGSEAFLTYLKEKGKDIVQFETELLLKEAGDDPTRRAGVLGQIANTISKIKNPLRRDEYVKVTRQVLGVDEGRMIFEVNKLLRRDLEKHQALEGITPPSSDDSFPTEEPGYVSNPVMAEAEMSVGDEFQEKHIAHILINAGGEWYDPEQSTTVAQYVWINIEDVIDYFDSKLYKKVVVEIMQRVNQGLEISAQYFINHPDTDVRQLASTVLTSPYEFSENWELKHEVFLNQRKPEDNYFKDAEAAVKRLKLRKLGRIIADNHAKMKAINQSDVEQLLPLIKLDQKLKAMRNQLAGELGMVVVK
jgi:DNA primase